MLVPLFTVTLFVSAFLLFLVQPMVAKMVLPLLGGSPMVWNTCMVFFQIALLAGYAYAHGATKWLADAGRLRYTSCSRWCRSPSCHSLSIAICRRPRDANRVVWSAGRLIDCHLVLPPAPPCFSMVLAHGASPCARSVLPVRRDNVGSFIALTAYPALVEPTLSLQVRAGSGQPVMPSSSCSSGRARSAHGADVTRPTRFERRRPPPRVKMTATW